MTVIDSYKNILDEVNNATIKSGRKEGDVKLLPISKTTDTNSMVSLIEIGVKSFGESRQQDAIMKLTELRLLGHNDINIEFIGRLQKNKIRKITTELSLIHSVDSVDIVNRIAGVATEFNLCKDILIQLNLAKEEQKGGVYLDDLDALIETVVAMSSVRLRGFMVIPPIVDINERNKRYFIDAKKIFDKYQPKISTIDTLSMGMSDDFDIAIAEGSTLVRVGSLIFS